MQNRTYIWIDFKSSNPYSGSMLPSGGGSWELIYLNKALSPTRWVTNHKYKVLHFLTTKYFFCDVKKTLAFNWDRGCHLALCILLSINIKHKILVVAKIIQKYSTAPLSKFEEILLWRLREGDLKWSWKL